MIKPKRRKKKKRKSKPTFSTGLFSGEMMRCGVCGREQQSDPNVESGWTRFQADDEVGYMCAQTCLPPGLSVEQVSNRVRTFVSFLAAQRAGEIPKDHTVDSWADIHRKETIQEYDALKATGAIPEGLSLKGWILREQRRRVLGDLEDHEDYDA